MARPHAGPHADFTRRDASRGAWPAAMFVQLRLCTGQAGVDEWLPFCPSFSQPGRVADIQGESMSPLRSFSWDVKGHGILLTESGELCVGGVSALFHTRKFG